MKNLIETSFATPLMWTGFAVFVLIMLALDLFVFGGRKTHRVSVKEAGIWVVVWIVLAFIFAVLMWFYLNHNFGAELANTKVTEFITGYLIEKSLSIDNMFVFVMLFNFFAVPPALQRRVLLYGVLGAIVMRAIMIFAGVALLREFEWLLLVFGAFLVVTGIKMFFSKDEEKDLSQNKLLQWIKGHVRITTEFHGEAFLVRKNGLLWMTPLLLALIFVELSDLVFAVDSIPAIFAVTTDPFIVLTSNIFAILGLRALYFLLVDMADRFSLLKYGLALILLFIGVKMLIEPWFHIPIVWSLLTVISVLIISIVLSKKHVK